MFTTSLELRHDFLLPDFADFDFGKFNEAALYKNEVM